MSTGLTVKLSGIVVLNFSIIVKYHFSFPFVCVYYLCFLKVIFNQKEKCGFIWPKSFDFLFQKPSKFYSEKMISSLKVFFFHKYRKKQLSIFVKSLKKNHEHELFHRCFSVFFFTFQEYLYKGTLLSGCFHLFQQRGFTNI